MMPSFCRAVIPLAAALQASVAAGLPFKDAGTPAGQSSRDVAASQALQPLPGQMERSSPGLSPMARAASSSPRSTPFSAGAPTQEEEALGPAAEEEGTEQVSQPVHAAVEASRLLHGVRQQEEVHIPQVLFLWSTQVRQGQILAMTHHFVGCPPPAHGLELPWRLAGCFEGALSMVKDRGSCSSLDVQNFSWQRLGLIGKNAGWHETHIRVCCLLQAAAAGESLEIENARLRCELASQIALDCARSALAGRDPAAVPTSAGSSPDGGAPSGAGGLGASGLLRSVSVPAVQGSVVGLGAWAGTPTQAGSVLVPGHGQAQVMDLVPPHGLPHGGSGRAACAQETASKTGVLRGSAGVLMHRLCVKPTAQPNVVSACTAVHTQADVQAPPQPLSQSCNSFLQGAVL